jgi:hypothetical protein
MGCVPNEDLFLYGPKQGFSRYYCKLNLSQLRVMPRLSLLI